MNLRDENPALLLVDIQQGLAVEDPYWGGKRNNVNAEEICGKILNQWRALNLPLFHIRHSSRNPKSLVHASHSGFAFNEHVLPKENEVVITKDVNSAFIGTNLQELLDESNIKTVVIIGLTTNHCISTTARMSENLGYKTILISDATATFDREGINGELYDAETIHLTTLASLRDEFAEIIDSEKLLKLL